MTKSDKAGAEAVHVLGAALALGMSLGMVAPATAADTTFIKMHGTAQTVKGTSTIKLHGADTVKGQQTIKMQGTSNIKLHDVVTEKTSLPPQ